MRRLHAHVRALPRDSALLREIEGDAAWWDRNSYLLADLIDTLNITVRWQLQAWGASPIPEFTAYPRPVAEPEAADDIPLDVLLEWVKGFNDA